jgi:hypothetical protein
MEKLDQTRFDKVEWINSKIARVRTDSYKVDMLDQNVDIALLPLDKAMKDAGYDVSTRRIYPERGDSSTVWVEYRRTAP